MKILGICYDFDKTLTPFNMQEQGFIDAVNMTASEFWGKSRALSAQKGVEGNLAYLYLMKELYKPLTRDTLKAFGGKITFFKGVEGWFDALNSYAAKRGVSVEHYVISSGNKEIIEGTAIADKFKKIYASSYMYDASGVAEWVGQSVNYTNKTQFLFRISKGVLDELSDEVNEKFASFRIPFVNMVYIGDSETDIPCMQIITSRGGSSVAVCDGDDKSEQGKRLKAEGRISEYFLADYSLGGGLYGYICGLIDALADRDD